MSVTIVQKEDSVLRQKAAEVHVKEIDTPKIRRVLADMKSALASQSDGVAIAAPQIGVPLRIFMISGKVFATASKTKLTKDDSDLVFINPHLTSLSRSKKFMEEGCLSVRYLYGKVKRSTKATIKAYNEKGNAFTKRGEDLLAQVFQHEVDHLEGILFTDTAKDIEDIPPHEHE